MGDGMARGRNFRLVQTRGEEGRNAPSLRRSKGGVYEERRLLACLALAFCTNSLAESPARQAAAKSSVVPSAGERRSLMRR